ncbi:hypothetical protein CGQ24_09330 [Arthrobacter sp. 7749]|nr:hypothetical protein CGQ24_09330 [Arthrobacter sp. 7749]
MLYKLRNDGWSPIKLTETYADMSECAREILELVPEAEYLRIASDDSIVEVLDGSLKVLHRGGDVDGGFDGIAGAIMYVVDSPEFREATRSGAHARGAVRSNFALTVADRTPLLNLARIIEPDMAHVVLYGQDSKLLSTVLRQASWPGEVTCDLERTEMCFTFQPASGESSFVLGVDHEGYPAGAVLAANGSIQDEVVRYRDWVHPAEILRDLRNRQR